jgi:2'-hydroxyisoflavone reductase
MAPHVETAEGETEENAMKILVVGGTGFLGGAIARCAANHGHDVSVLSRGLKPATVIPGVTYIAADRVKDLSALRGRKFDVVADTSAFAPWHVTSLLDELDQKPSLYAFVSSINVYGTHTMPQMDETASTPRATSEHFEAARKIPVAGQCDGASYDEEYGPLKREAELVAIERLGDAALILRAGLLVGAGDYTDRLTYWVRCTDEGGEFAAPGRPDRLVQLIDVQDVANFVLDAAEKSRGGIFNLTGNPMPFGKLLESCIAVAGSTSKLRWIPEAHLAENKIAPWTDLPMWLPESDTKFAHFMNASIDKALTHGLKFRSLNETLNEILTWDRNRRHINLKCGLSPEQKVKLLAKD